MTTFKYKGISEGGQKVSGVIDAYSEAEAASRLREKCSVITSITEMRDSGAGSLDFNISKIKDKSLAILCSQFSIILSSGLPIVRCVEMVANQTTDKNLKNMHESLQRHSRGGREGYQLLQLQ